MPKLSDFNPKDIKIVAHPEAPTQAPKMPEPSEIPEAPVSALDLAAMAGQGALLSTGDEILGALQAVKDVALTDKELGDLPELYYQHQKENEAKYKALREANPNLALGAEFAGGYLLPGGMFIKGAKTSIDALKKLGLLKALLKSGVEGAKTAAPMGALAGFGSSESDLRDIKGLSKDIAFGTAGGALIGGGLSAGGTGLVRGVDALPGALSKLGAMGENFLRAFRMAKEGKGVISPESAERIAKEGKEASAELAQQLMEPAENVTKEIGKYFQDAGDAGAKVLPNQEVSGLLAQFLRNLQESGQAKVGSLVDKRKFNAKLKSLAKQLEENKISKVDYDAAVKQLNDAPPLSKSAVSKTLELLRQQGTEVTNVPHELEQLNLQIQRLLKGELTPQEAINLGKQLGEETIGKLAKVDRPDLVPPALPGALKKAGYEAADVAMGTPGGSQKLLDKFEDVRALIPETILNKGDPKEYANELLRKFGAGEVGLKKAETALYDEIKNKILPKLADPVTTADEVRETIRVLRERIGEVNKKYNMNINLDDALSRMKGASQEKVIRSKIITKHGEKDSVEGLAGKLVDWTGYGGAQLLGTGARVGSKALDATNRAITTASDVTLMPIAQALKANKKVEFLGNALESALNNKSVAAKNAVIFSIMQNPEARRMVQDSIPGMGSEEP